jgi:hypothetical protein
MHLKGKMYLDAATSSSNSQQFIEIRSNPYQFKNYYTDIVPFMRQYDILNLDYDNPKSAMLTFKSNLLQENGKPMSVSLFQVDFNIAGHGPNTGIACTRHFVVRKDLFINGMLNSIEGAVVLHAGKYRQWDGQPSQPTIFSGGETWQTGDFNTIEFRRMDTNKLIPIHCSGLRDSNGNLGANGQVLTNTNTGLLWQNAVNVMQRIEKGQVQTNNNGDDVIVNFSPAYANQPIITTGCLDASARSISVTITSLAGQPQNDFRTGFRIRASIATNASHVHKQMTVGTRTTVSAFNANRVRSANIGDIEAVIYSINDGGNGTTHDVNTDSATSSQVITRVPNLTLHYIAIGT